MPNYWGDYKNFAFYIFANNLFVFQFFLFLLKFPLIVSSGMYVLVSLKLFLYRIKIFYYQTLSVGQCKDDFHSHPLANYFSEKKQGEADME